MTPRLRSGGSRALRRDGWRRLILKHVAIAGVSVTRLAQALGHTRQRLQAKLDDDETAELTLSSIGVLLEELGDAWYHEANQALGYRLVPVAAHALKAEDAMASIASLLREAGEGAARALEVLADGVVTTEEDAAARRELEDIRRACAQVEAQLDARREVLPFSGRSRR